MAEVEVTNVVGMITYRQELDLGTLAETFSQRAEITDVTYEPAENHWLQSRFSPDDTYVAFYRNGRCTIAGCKSVDHFCGVVDRVNSVMGNLLEFEYEPEAKVSNIVATSDLGTSIPLELVAIDLGMDIVEYEPELFPGLIYRPAQSDCVILLFASGRVVITGGSSLDTAERAFETVKDKITDLLAID